MKSTRQPTGEIVRAIIRRIVIAGLPHLVAESSLEPRRKFG